MKRTSFILLILGVLVSCKTPQKEKKAYLFNSGIIYGTTYNIQYEHPQGIDVHEDIQASLSIFDASMSTFKSSSTISKVNQNDAKVVLDDFFMRTYQKAMSISELTNGAFDMTVAPLVNIWGFGFEDREKATNHRIDSILQFVGYQKIKIENGAVIKEDPRIRLDASAIAKGLAVDIIAELLDSVGCENYMVEIGGEVSTRGLSKRAKPWRIGINKPKDNAGFNEEDIQAVVSLSGQAMATSGNYRNYYEEDGQRFAHTIDPKSGYPVQHSLLSASIVANDCMTADAIATACMVMGLEESLRIVEQTKDVEGFFIIADDAEGYNIFSTKGFPVEAF